jgi:outer membrane protein assembly factor BamB
MLQRRVVPVPIVLTLLLLCIPAPAGGAAGDWPQAHGTADHRGYAVDETILGTGNVAGLMLAWSRDVADPNGEQTWFESSPVVASGVVYTTDFTYNFASHPERYVEVRAFDAATGSPLWVETFLTPRGTSTQAASTPAVWGDVLYVAIGRSVLGLDVATGETVWSARTGGKISGDLTIARVGKRRVLFAVSDHLYAFALASGERLWVSRTTWPTDWGFESAIQYRPQKSTPTVAGGRVFVGSWMGWLRAFDAATGKLLWTYWADRGTEVGAPSVADGVVYAGVRSDFAGSAGVVALDAESGDALAFAPTTLGTGGDAEGDPIDGTPAVGEAALYAIGRSGILYAYSRDLAPMWQTDLQGPGKPSPALANGVVYAPVEYGLSGVDAVTGVVLWSSLSEGTFIIGASPAISNGRVFTADYTGTVFAYGLAAP